VVLVNKAPWECLGLVEDTGPRVNKDLWEPPVKWDLKVLWGPKEAKVPSDHLERWALKDARATRVNRVARLWFLRGTGNSASGAN